MALNLKSFERKLDQLLEKRREMKLFKILIILIFIA